ncbi:hypothetical protein PHYPSEUDO_003545 [Phytophthora pseudosyringae]|uniref:RxLR effector protein n=1 Tax=Phytophthora pseudosyringae TaxID=221518 RepID=A0A8T1VRJ9_9STRA|nr:hypothetical protein PHYPSEUDO_003545 [Phytophthora pseudosyringae]
MRLTYILAVVIAATLHASGTALSANKGGNAVIENGASPDTIDSTYAGGERLLRRVEKNAAHEDAAEDEERLFKGLKKYLNYIPSKLKDRLEVSKAKEQLKTSRLRHEKLKEQGLTPLT